jgi:putative photosynthetic complex assembly protein 2
MAEQAYPILFALFLWWFSTGAIIYLDGLPRRTYRWSIAGATALAAVGLVGIGWSASQTQLHSMYCAFSCALLVWGWCEITFLMGFITGPRRTPCPPGISIGKRFWLSCEVLAHHELALLLAGLLIAALSWGAVNTIAIETFALLWIMRLSTKINIFFGVPNVAAEVLPSHLDYLKSYFRVRPFNWFMPFSLTLAVGLFWVFVTRATAPDTSSTDIAGAKLLATLAGLGVLEHILLIVPLSPSALWGWSMGNHTAAQSARVLQDASAAKAPQSVP